LVITLRTHKDSRVSRSVDAIAVAVFEGVIGQVWKVFKPFVHGSIAVIIDSIADFIGGLNSAAAFTPDASGTCFAAHSARTDICAALAHQSFIDGAIAIIVFIVTGLDGRRNDAYTFTPVSRLAGLLALLATADVAPARLNEPFVDLSIAIIINVVADLDTIIAWGTFILTAIGRSRIEVDPAFRALSDDALAHLAGWHGILESTCSITRTAVCKIALDIEALIRCTVTVVIYAIADFNSSVCEKAWTKLAAIFNGHVEIVVALVAGLDPAGSLHAVGESIGQCTHRAAGTAVIDVGGQVKSFISLTVTIVIEAVAEHFVIRIIGLWVATVPFAEYTFGCCADTDASLKALDIIRYGVNVFICDRVAVIVSIVAQFGSTFVGH